MRIYAQIHRSSEQGKRTVKLIVSLLTGHYRLNKNMTNVGLRDNASFRQKKGPGNTFYINFLGLTRFKKECIDKPYPESASCMKTTLPKRVVKKGKTRTDRLNNRNPQYTNRQQWKRVHDGDTTSQILHSSRLSQPKFT